MSLSPLSLKEKEKENVLWHICANTKSPPKSILGLILLGLKGAKSHKYLLSP
jgi:hypothetical protein